MLEIIKEEDLSNKKSVLNKWVIVQDNLYEWYGLNLEKFFIALNARGKFIIFDKYANCISLQCTSEFNTLEEAKNSLYILTRA